MGGGGLGRSTVSIMNLGLKRSQEPCKKFSVGRWMGGGGGGWVHSEFSVLLWFWT